MSTVILPAILQSVEPIINSYGYFAVGGILLLEDFGLPVPGETVLLAAALFAGAGRLNVYVLLVVGILGAVIGDSIGFAIGHYGGERLLKNYGRYVFLSDKKLDTAHKFFSKYGSAVVLVARFVDGLRQLNGIIAGTTDMRWRRFIVFNAIGATLWTATWVSLGYFAGDRITSIYRVITEFGLYALGIVVITIAVALIGKRLLRRSI
jgi:membrane protein DedA with SNARE-associated domain